MNKPTRWIKLLGIATLLAAIVLIVSLASAGSTLPEDVEVFWFRGKICIDAGEWGQCWCPGECRSECDDDESAIQILPTDQLEPEGK